MMARVEATTATSVSPDSGLHWTEPGAWPVAPGVHRIPLPLPMDGLRAVNVYVLETDDGLTLVDGGWAIPESRARCSRSRCATIGCRVRRHPPLPRHPRPPRPLHAGGHDPPEVGAPRQPRARRQADPRPGCQRGRRSHEDPYRRRPATRRRRTTWPTQWAELHAPARTPDLEHVGTTPTPGWTEDHPIDVGGRVLDAVHTPGHTQGHFVFADRAAGLLFAGDHVLPTITPSIGFEPVLADAAARRLPRLAHQGARPARPAAAAGPRAGGRLLPRPGRRAARPPRRPAAPVPATAVRPRRRDGVRRRAAAAVDPARARLRRARRVQRGARHAGDPGPPRAARRPRAADGRRGPRRRRG